MVSEKGFQKEPWLAIMLQELRASQKEKMRDDSESSLWDQIIWRKPPKLFAHIKSALQLHQFKSVILSHKNARQSIWGFTILTQKDRQGIDCNAVWTRIEFGISISMWDFILESLPKNWFLLLVLFFVCICVRFSPDNVFGFESKGFSLCTSRILAKMPLSFNPGH